MFSIFLLLIYACKSDGYGYDAGTDQGACGKPYRSSRMHQPPCDLARQNYCTTAGTMYPWHAVRRFIRENQGLMKRMYGDERHIAVLRAELQTNDVTDEDYSEDDLYKNGDFKSRYAKQNHEFDNELYEDEARYFQDRKEEIILNTKFVYSQDPNLQIKLKDLQAPRFRPTTEKSLETNTEKAVVSTNETLEVAQENTTEIFYEVEDGNVTQTEKLEAEKLEMGKLEIEKLEMEKLGTEKLEMTESEENFETTTEFLEETTTQAPKKVPNGEMLFQDVENNKANIHQVNYKLRGVNACPVKEEVVAPFWANNTRGEVLALLNLYPFEQYVHWEKCTFEHRQMYCREGCRCEQQYRLHRLLAYDPNNECRGIFSDWFRFPSCCVCKCYDMPAEFRVTSRSPRSKEEKPLPNWFKKKNKGKTFNKND